MASLGTVTRGDAETITFTVRNADGSTRNITTDSLTFTLRKSPDGTIIVQKTVGAGITKTNAALGQGEIALGATDLLNIRTAGTYHADIQVTDASSRSYTTLFDLYVQLDITT